MLTRTLHTQDPYTRSNQHAGHLANPDNQRNRQQETRPTQPRPNGVPSASFTFIIVELSIQKGSSQMPYPGLVMIK